MKRPQATKKEKEQSEKVSLPAPQLLFPYRRMHLQGWRSRKNVFTLRELQTFLARDHTENDSLT